MSQFFKGERWLTAGWLTLWLMLSGTLLLAANWQADQELHDRMTAFEQQTLDLSEVAEQIVVSRIAHYDEVLLVLRNAFVTDPQRFPETIKHLRSGPLADPELLVVLVGPDGHLAYTDAPNVQPRLYLGDRPYFRFFADGGKDQFFIDEPRFGRTTRRYTLPVVRPIFGQEGQFLGVIALSIKQDSLSNFGHSLARATDTTISVVTQNGSIVTRSRDLVKVQGTKLATEQLVPMQNGTEGVYQERATNDEIARVIAYQRPAGVPLIIFAEAYPRNLLHETTQERALLQLSAVAASLLLLAVLLVLLQRRKMMARFIATQQAHLLEAQRIAEMGSWELDLSNKRFKWSAEVYQIFGVSAETFEPSLENFLALVLETDRAAVQLEIEKVITDGQGSIEFLLLRGDGQVHRIFGRGEAVRNPKNQVVSLIGTVRDVTEQRNAERALRESEAKLRAIMDNVSAVIFMKDTAGRYLYINRKYEQLFHISNSAIQGKTDYDIFPREMADAYLKNDQTVIQSRQPHEIEEQVPHDEGMHFYLTSKFPIRHADDKIYAVCGVAIDITARKQAEQMAYRLILRNQVLMQNALDGIHILDHHGQIQEANLAFCALLGYTPAEIQLLNVADWEARMSASELKEKFAMLLDGGNAQFETINRRKDGSLIHVEVSAIGVELDGKKFIYAATRDITERKRNQQQLENLVQQRTAELSRALQAAQIADQTKDAFLANITHELRTPLSAIIGFAGLARPFSINPRQGDYLDKIVSAGKTLSSIINDLLDLSKIAAGRLELENGTFSLRQLLSRSRSIMSFKAEEKGLALIEQIDDDIPDILLGDTLRIEQILLNLLSNAVKFTHSGSVELRVALHARIGARVGLRIEVEDSGIGLSQEAISLLFKPFAQADASMSRKFGGTGLGLSICKHLAELMGGAISVSSRQGHGTTFSATLWLALGDVSELAAIELPVDQSLLPASYEDARVLVVDDQLFNREVVNGLLAVVGIAPHTANNGQEALDLLVETGPAAFDLILMDVQMPVMDGLTATRIIRKLDGFGQLPIVAMTAHTMAHEKEAGSAAGMNDHIGKPFEDLDFYRVLAKWLPHSKHRAQPGALAPVLQPLGNPLPTLRGIDTRAGLALFVGDAPRYRHWLSNFIDEAPTHVAQIQQALTCGQAEQCASSAHILKGRAGMLGMSELYAISTALEAAIDDEAPINALQEQLNQVTQVVRQLCDEISRTLSLPEKTACAPEFAPLLNALPEGPVPPSIVHLLALLATGDGDCDIATARCLAELSDTAWAPRLQQALVYAENFDFDAASRLLFSE